MNPKTTFIYALCDPLTHEVRYVGKSNKPNARFGGHLNEAKNKKNKKNKKNNNNRKNNWIAKLLSNKLIPIMIILEEVCFDKWQTKEQYYISLHRSFSNRLTNLSDGGDGQSGKICNEKEKDRLRQISLGRKHPPRSEHWKQKQRASHLGRKDSKEAFENKSKAQSGQNNPRAKEWALKSPEGEIIQIKSLKTWCKENKVSLTMIHKNTDKQKTGVWTVVR